MIEVKSTLLILTLAVFTACSPYPRYKTGGGVAVRVPTATRAAMTTNQRIELATILQGFLGRPYKGKSKYEDGVDCSFFTREVFLKYNKTDLARTASGQFEQGETVAQGRIQFGDLVFFRTDHGRISHVGIYLGYGLFIHASTSRGVIISGLGEKYWAQRYAGARRIILPPAPKASDEKKR